ncbi:MAG: cation-efflux pump [Rudaea sp.]
MREYLNKRTGAVTLSVMSNTTLVLLKLVVGIMTGSVSVISEAIHSSTDLMAALIAFFAIRQAARPADENHPYGHGKAESLAAAIEALLIFLAAGMIIYEAAQRLIEAHPVENLGLGVGVMFFSSAVNLVVSRHLFSVARRTESPALAADAWHLSTDLLTALGVGIGLILVRVTGILALDPLVAIGVALFIVKAAWDITRGSLADLMDESLPEQDQAKIRAVLDRHRDRFSSVRVLRARRAGGARRIYVALEFPATVSISDAHEVTQQLEDEIRSVYPAANVIVEAESPAQQAGETAIETVERVARRIGLPVHRIEAAAAGDRTDISVHVEVEPSITLEEAHARANRLEEELRAELPALGRVQTHIEPVSRETLSQQNADRAQVRVWGALNELMEQEPGLGVHDVQVVEKDGRLTVTLHLALDGSVPIDEAHRLGSEIEAHLRQEVPELAGVLIHTEPTDQA